MRIKKLKIAVLLFVISILQGCSGLSDKDLRTRPDGTPMTEYQIYENEIKDGVFYVRHLDSICEPVYFGEPTFDKGSVSKIKTISVFYGLGTIIHVSQRSIKENRLSITQKDCSTNSLHMNVLRTLAILLEFVVLKRLHPADICFIPILKKNAHIRPLMLMQSSR